MMLISNFLTGQDHEGKTLGTEQTNLDIGMYLMKSSPEMESSTTVDEREASDGAKSSSPEISILPASLRSGIKNASDFQRGSSI